MIARTIAALILVLAFASSVRAECAWVMWSGKAPSRLLKNPTLGIGSA
jgi:hypothetical protein